MQENDNIDVISNIGSQPTKEQPTSLKLACGCDRYKLPDKFLTKILDSLTHPFYVIDVKDQTIVVSNKAAGDYIADHGKKCYQVTHNNESPCWMMGEDCPIRAVKETGKPTMVEHEHHKKDGSIGIFEVYGFPVFDDDGNVVQMIEYTLDITKRKKLEKELIESKEKAEAATQAKSSFLANMSHEIRTPLSGVLGMLELMDDGELNYEQKEHLNLAKTSASDLLSIINDLLDISKIEAGMLELECTTFSLKRNIEKRTSVYQKMAEVKGLNLTVEISQDVPETVVGDPVRTMQILNNLLNNALKFTKQGLIDVTVKMKDTDTILISVSDTGIGISPEKQKTIFNSFTQAEEDTTRNFGGTGLGLTISHNLVKMMDGDLWIESDLGTGTTFHFVLPVKPQSCVMRETKSNGEKCLRPVKSKIFLVEDSNVNRILAQKLLEKAGYEVFTAKDGEEAVNIFKQGIKPDLILMDIRMPVMDGMEATTRIRELEPPDCHVPIIALTAHALKGDRERFIAAGMDDYLAKPLSADRLYTMLMEHIKKKSIKADLIKPSMISMDDFMKRVGDLDLAHRLLEIYIEDAPKAMTDLKIAVNSKDSNAVMENAHKIKGMSANISAEHASSIFFELEEMGSKNRLLGIEIQLEKASIILQETLSDIDEILNSKKRIDEDKKDKPNDGGE